MIEKLRDRIQNLRLGHSLDKSVDMGAIVDPSQKKSVEQYVEEARSEGAEVSGLGKRLVNCKECQLHRKMCIGCVEQISLYSFDKGRQYFNSNFILNVNLL